MYSFNDSALSGILGGIRQTAPAWNAVLFRPLFWGESARIAIPTPHGLLESSWHEKNDGEIEVQLSLPEGIEARVELPTMDPL